MEEDRVVRTLERSSNVRARLRFVGELLRQRHPFKVLSTKGERQEGRMLGKYGSSC